MDDQTKKALCCGKWVMYGELYAQLFERAGRAPKADYTAAEINAAFDEALGVLEGRLLPLIGRGTAQVPQCASDRARATAHHGASFP